MRLSVFSNISPQIVTGRYLMNVSCLLASILATLWVNESACLAGSIESSIKPKVWIYTDMSDKALPGNNHRGTINDLDDISAMAGYLLMANQSDTLGIVATSTNRRDHAMTPDQGGWARQFFGTAYAKFKSRESICM